MREYFRDGEIDMTNNQGKKCCANCDLQKPNTTALKYVFKQPKFKCDGYAQPRFKNRYNCPKWEKILNAEIEK